MSSAIQKALRPLGRDIREIEKLQVSRKGVADFVTSADKRTEDILKQELSKARPDFGFITEENPKVIGKDKTHFWVIDPIDGTTNFMRGLPHFAICIALIQYDEVVAALTFDPMKNEEFFAEKDKGTYLNGDRVRISSRDEMNLCLLGTGLPFAGCEGYERASKEISAFMPLTAGIRRMGAASLDLAYVATGRLDGYWERNLQIWDIAGGLLMVKEAGGMITTTSGKNDVLQTGDVLVSNGKIHRKMLDVLEKVG